MEAEILKAYYPYDLCVVTEERPSDPYRIRGFTQEVCLLESSWNQWIEVPIDSEAYKPVLYPLSRLDSPIKARGGRTINPMEEIGKLLARCSATLQIDPQDQWFRKVLTDYLQDKIWCPFQHEVMKNIYNLLYRFHFDLDRLIETGRAIDATTLAANPYNFYHINFN